jgi:CsoR family transcriptional regulator, copper-sensing transcriptional repressor
MLSIETNKKIKATKSKQKAAHDHSAELKRLSRIKGQVEGIERMISERRYCPEGHVRHCVKDAIASRDAATIDEKIEEVIILFKGQG